MWLNIHSWGCRYKSKGLFLLQCYWEPRQKMNQQPIRLQNSVTLQYNTQSSHTACLLWVKWWKTIHGHGFSPLFCISYIGHYYLIHFIWLTDPSGILEVGSFSTKLRAEPSSMGSEGIPEHPCVLVSPFHQGLLLKMQLAACRGLPVVFREVWSIGIKTFVYRWCSCLHSIF